MEEGRSLMYIRDGRGPKRDHCRTPEVTGGDKEEQLLAITNYVLELRKILIPDIMVASRLNVDNLRISLLCGTLAKALEKSKRQHLFGCCCHVKFTMQILNECGQL